VAKRRKVFLTAAPYCALDDLPPAAALHPIVCILSSSVL
jgi:hypothetical protein